MLCVQVCEHSIISPVSQSMSHLKVVPCMMLRALLDMPDTSFLPSGLLILEILLWQWHRSPLPHVMLLGEQIWSLSMLWLTFKAWLEAADWLSLCKYMPMLALRCVIWCWICMSISHLLSAYRSLRRPVCRNHSALHRLMEPEKWIPKSM